MLKRCKSCSRFFRTYIPSQIFCCYDCKAAFSGENKGFLTVDEILGLGGISYGRMVDEISKGDR